MLTWSSASGTTFGAAWYDVPVEPRGQVVFVFTAAFADEAAYEIGEQAILDTPDRTRVIWRPPAAAIPPLYPEGVADLAGTCA
jgi:hypothetical protein